MADGPAWALAFLQVRLSGVAFFLGGGLLAHIADRPARLYRVSAAGRVQPPGDLPEMLGMGVCHFSPASHLPSPDETPVFICIRCASTQDLLPLLKQRYRLSPGASLLCLHQQQGRGQFGRQWISPPGNLTVTTLCGGPLMQNPPFSLLLGAATVAALRQKGANALRLKWPNDLVADQDGTLIKVGGMLLEQRSDAHYWGLALNLGDAPALVSPGHLPAGSLLLPSKTPLATWLAIFPQILHSITLWQQLDPEEIIRHHIVPLLAMRGQDVVFLDHRLGDYWQPATLLGINADGSALLQTGRGERHSLYSGSLLPQQQFDQTV